MSSHVDSWQNSNHNFVVEITQLNQCHSPCAWSVEFIKTQNIWDLSRSDTKVNFRLLCFFMLNAVPIKKVG